MFKDCQVIQYADDTTIYITGKNINIIKSKLEGDLNSLKDWFMANKLSLNLNKNILFILHCLIVNNYLLYNLELKNKCNKKCKIFGNNIR